MLNSIMPNTYTFAKRPRINNKVAYTSPEELKNLCIKASSEALVSADIFIADLESLAKELDILKLNLEIQGGKQHYKNKANFYIKQIADFKNTSLRYKERLNGVHTDLTGSSSKALSNVVGTSARAVYGCADFASKVIELKTVLESCVHFGPDKDKALARELVGEVAGMEETLRKMLEFLKSMYRIFRDLPSGEEGSVMEGVKSASVPTEVLKNQSKDIYYFVRDMDTDLTLLHMAINQNGGKGADIVKALFVDTSFFRAVAKDIYGYFEKIPPSVDVIDKEKTGAVSGGKSIYAVSGSPYIYGKIMDVKTNIKIMSSKFMNLYFDLSGALNSPDVSPEQKRRYTDFQTAIQQVFARVTEKDSFKGTLSKIKDLEDIYGDNMY
ncbi:MAG: hypothetical protein ABIH00_03740 [Armatimonadota bacterium]